jgi:alkylation response protein AidB-like acyl-CoA dehydrogenase
LPRAVEHAKSRVQFGQPLAGFEMVKEKLAHMAADTFAMESATYQTAALIDSGADDYMLETAMLKVFATEALWTIVNDTFQIYGGKAYFTDEPLERMLRDARINQIGEGANDVLRSFIGLVGMRGPGEELLAVWKALQHPWKEQAGRPGIVQLWEFGRREAAAAVQIPDVPVLTSSLHGPARSLGRLIRQFNHAVRRELVRHGEEIIERQYAQERIAEAAMDLFASACVLSRLDACSAPSRPTGISEPEARAGGLARAGNGKYAAQSAGAPGDLFLRIAARRIQHNLAALRSNDDAAVTAAADWMLREE